MNSRIFYLLSFLALVTCSILGWPLGGDANADDTKHVPAVVCQAYNINEDYELVRVNNGLLYSPGTGELANPITTSTMYVSCPVLADYIHSTRTDAFTLFDVRVKDYSASYNVSCTLYSYSQTSASMDYTSASTSGSSSYWQTLDLDNATLTPYSNGYYVTHCGVPRRGEQATEWSGISGMRYVEDYAD